MNFAEQQPLDLKAARLSASFSSDELINILYTQDEIKLKKKCEDILSKEPIFDKSNVIHLSRNERFLHGLKMAKRLVELKYENQLTEKEFRELEFKIDEPISLHLQNTMFVSAIETQTSKEQRERWLQDVYDFKILGCYAQTELGHGSSLANLETTATFDSKTDEFIINSPTLTSAKFWPGALGKFSNHAIVYAQLIINGKNYGPHGFLTPTRSLEDHKPLKGIILKDIGPKVGYEGMDNGYATFDHVRIPRENMLMGFSKVDRHGNYSKPPHSKIGFAIMTRTRVRIVKLSFLALSRAITIAIRYCIVRRQGPNANTLEPQVIDYPLVQYRIFPILAEAFSMNFVAQWIFELYDQMMIDIEKKGDFKLLPDIHGISSALKGYCSSKAANDIEEARRCLGGQGYLKASGIPDYYNSFIPSMTYEGENGLLTQQTARFLLKQYDKVLSGNFTDLTGTTSFIQELHLNKEPYILELKSKDHINLLKELVKAFSLRTFNLLKPLHKGSKKLPFTQLSVLCQKITQAYSEYLHIHLTYSFIYKRMRQNSLSSNLVNVLVKLGLIYAISLIDKSSGEFLEAKALNSSHLSYLRKQTELLFKLIRPEVATLVDGFNHSDYFLNSALGPYNGNVYEQLVKGVMENPLNSKYSKDEVIEGYHEYIKPMVTGQIKAAYEAPSKKIQPNL